MVVHVDDLMASGPPGEAEKLFEAVGMHIATRLVQPLHYSEASVYLGTRLWSTKSGFLEMQKEDYIEGIRTIAEQAGFHVQGGRGPKTKDDEDFFGRELHSIYMQIVGKVQYITPRRPDVMFALKEAARHLQEPRWFDWYRLGRLVRYLCDTGSYAMHLQHSGNTREVIAYSDADWAGCTETRRSTSCCLIFWGDFLLHAHSWTQVQIGLSSPESRILRVLRSSSGVALL